MKKRFTDEQIIGFLKEAEAGTPVKELCRKHGFSDAAFYGWRSRFGGMEVADAARLRTRRRSTIGSRSCWPRLTWTSKL